MMQVITVALVKFRNTDESESLCKMHEARENNYTPS